jgi:hypothetical protein
MQCHKNLVVAGSSLEKLERDNLYIYNESAKANPHHFLFHGVVPTIL